MTTSNSISLFDLLHSEFGETVPTISLSKPTLIEISHALENTVLTNRLPAMALAGFQASVFWEQEQRRYQHLAQLAHSLYIFAVPFGVAPSSSRQYSAVDKVFDEDKLVMLDLNKDDALGQEWFLVILTENFSVLLCGIEQGPPGVRKSGRVFETILSFEPRVIERGLNLLESVVGRYRADKLEQLQAGRKLFSLIAPKPLYITLLINTFIKQIDQHRPVTRHLDQTEAMLATLRTLLHEISQPLTALLVLLDVFEPQSTISKENLQDLAANLDSLKAIAEKMRQTTTYSSYQVGQEEHLKLNEAGDIIIE